MPKTGRETDLGAQSEGDEAAEAEAAEAVEAVVAAEATPSDAERPRHETVGSDRTGECELTLLQEYGVIHLRGCLSERGQQELWGLTKPYANDPAGRATGFSNFLVSSSKKGRPKRIPAYGAFGAEVFGACAEALSAASEEDIQRETTYMRLRELAEAGGG